MLRLGSSGLPQWSVSPPPGKNEPGVLGLSFPLICLPGLPSGGSPLALPPSSFLVGLGEEKEVTREQAETSRTVGTSTSSGV